MAIKSEIQIKKELILTLDNKDKEILEAMVTKWDFKDEQSLIRFMLGVLYNSTKTSLTIHTERGEEEITPADDFINGK